MSFHLLDTFLYRASIAPEHTALVDIRHTSRDRYEEQRISYGQLKQCIELITAYFKQVNIGHSTAVVVYLDSSWELVAIMLSLWMVRAIYIPANAENVEAICNRWSVTHLLGRTMWSNNSNNQVWHATPIDIGADIDVFHYTRSVDDQSSCLHSSNNFLNNTAYIAHTSGTTRGGQGCGLAVQVPYHVLDANLQSISARLRLMHSPTVLWSSPPTFDPSFVELGLALSDYTDSEQSRSSCIGQLVIIPTTLRRTPHLLARIISDTRVTLLMMTPSLFMSLNSVFVKQLLQGKYKCIRDIILGGEPFPITWLTTHSDYLNENDSNNDEDEDEDDDTLRGRASKRRKQHDHASVSENRHQSALYPRLWNIYGTTECSIWATLHQVDLSTDLAEGVPLGTPLSGITLSIHERKDKQSMKGQSVGELVITVDDSRCCRIDDETEPIYERDTGDLVRRDNASQRVYYEGRVDRQIKRWGHRIQLEDIERQIMSCSNDIEQCCVLLVNPSTNDKHIHSLSMARIVAFLELKHDNDDIRHQVQSKIEEKSSIYARPDHYVILPTMPLTSNGKINMTELRQSISVDALSYNNVMHKDSMLPMTICNIRHHVWQLLDHLLGKHSDEEDDYYVAMGGTSVEAVRIIHCLWERWTLGTHLEDDKINQQQKWLDSLLHDSIATFIIKVHQSLSNLQIDINKIDEQTRKYSDISTAANVNITGTIDVFNLSFINDSIIKRASVNRISSSVSSFSSKGQIRWRIDLAKCIDASPIIAYYRHSLLPDKLYGIAWIGSHAGLMAAVHVEQGVILWQIQLPDRIESSACISHDGQYVIVGCYDGRLYVITALTGQIINRFTTGSMIKSSPCVDPQSGSVWFGSHDGHLYRVRIRSNATTCALEGRLDCGSPLFSSCAIDSVNKIVIVASLKGDIWAIDSTYNADHPARLVVLWKSSVRDYMNDHDGDDDDDAVHATPYFSTPAIDTNRQCVIIGNANGYLYCFSTMNGTCLWECNSHGPIFSSPCLWQDRVIVGSHAGSLLCCSIDTGCVLWQTRLPPLVDDVQASNEQPLHNTGIPVYASPFIVHHATTNGVVEHDYVIAASIDGRLWIGDVERGMFQSWIQLPGEVFSSPICALYSRDMDTDDTTLVTSSTCILIGSRDNGFYAIQ